MKVYFYVQLNLLFCFVDNIFLIFSLGPQPPVLRTYCLVWPSEITPGSAKGSIWDTKYWTCFNLSIL